MKLPRIFILLWAILVLWSAQNTAFAEIRLRFGAHDNYTRIVLEAPDEPLYRIFSLPQPARLVVDLRQVKLSRSLSVQSGLVKGYRFGQFEEGVTRVVIDLKDNFTVSKFFHLDKNGDNGFRIVIDVAKAEKTAEFLRLAKAWDNYRDNYKAQQKALAQELAARRAPLPPHYKPDKTAALPLIVVDAGHGGVDSGAVGKKILEKHITLAAAQEIKKAFEKSGRYRVLLTRKGDVFLPLRKRYAIAEKANAALLISLHADAVDNKSVRGSSVYTLSDKASDKEAQKLAERENAADSNAGQSHAEYDAELVRVLVDLEQRGTQSESAKIAGHVVMTLKKDKKRLINNPHRFAGFAVLKSPKVPSILVEMGFISNAQEEKTMKTAKFRRTFAKSLLRAVDGYFHARQF